MIYSYQFVHLKRSYNYRGNLHVFPVGLDLESGARYFLIVRAINFAGLHVQASSDGFTVDFTPPLASTARLGTGIEPAKYQSDLTKLVVRCCTQFVFSF